jgi:hypothetical protein
MSDPTFSIQRGDLLPVLEVVLRNPDGTPFDLTNTSAVRFRMWNSNGNVSVTSYQVDAAAAIVDAAAGRVRYTWAGSDTAIAGTFYGEFALTVGGKPQRAPTVGVVVVKVLE